MLLHSLPLAATAQSQYSQHQADLSHFEHRHGLPYYTMFCSSLAGFLLQSCYVGLLLAMMLGLHRLRELLQPSLQPMPLAGKRPL